jgi:hypothetical protein
MVAACGLTYMFVLLGLALLVTDVISRFSHRALRGIVAAFGDEVVDLVLGG